VRFVRQEEDDGDPGFDIETWAGALGALDKCVCGTKLVDDEALADSLIKRYRLRGEKAERARQKIVDAVVNSGVEISDGLGLCSYCSYAMNKDD
jgi:hypothetical protein